MSLSLEYPERTHGQNEVIIRRGDAITLVIAFHDEPPDTYISVERGGISFPSPPGATPTEPDKLSLELMELRDVTSPHSVYRNVIRSGNHDYNQIYDATACGCLVHFYGRYFAIADRKTKICFEFPVITHGSDQTQEYMYVAQIFHWQ